MPDVYHRDGICIPDVSRVVRKRCRSVFRLKCSVDSNFPAGTTFDVALYQSGYTATRHQPDHLLRSRKIMQPCTSCLIRKDCPGGQYKVEVQFNGLEEGKLSSDSVTWQLPRILDRSGTSRLPPRYPRPLMKRSGSRDQFSNSEMTVLILRSGDRMVLSSGHNLSAHDLI